MVTCVNFGFFFQVCKKKKAYNNLKSPKENSGSMGSKHSNAKAYKHIKLLPLSFVMKVVDIKETEGKYNEKYNKIMLFQVSHVILQN